MGDQKKWRSTGARRTTSPCPVKPRLHSHVFEVNRGPAIGPTQVEAPAAGGGDVQAVRVDLARPRVGWASVAPTDAQARDLADGFASNRGLVDVHELSPADHLGPSCGDVDCVAGTVPHPCRV